MPRPKPQRQILSIPLTSGLAQKESPEWLQLGQAITLQGYEKNKVSTIQKQMGFFQIPAPASFVNTTIVDVATNDKVLLEIGNESYLDIPATLYAFNSTAGTNSFIDLIPNLAISPVNSLASYVQTIGDIDAIGVPPVVSGFESNISLCVFSLDVESNGIFRVYWFAYDILSGRIVSAPQEVSSLSGISTSTGLTAPRLAIGSAAIGSSTVYLAVGQSGSSNIYGTTLSAGSGAFGSWTTAVVLASDVNQNSIAAFGWAETYPAPVALTLAYEKDASGTKTIHAATFNDSLALQTAGDLTDATYAGQDVTGMAVATDYTQLWIAYAYSSGSGLTTQTAVYAGAMALDLGSTTSAPADLSAGMLGLYPNYPGPRLISLTYTGSLNMQAMWSPPDVHIGYDPRYVATPVPVKTMAPPLCAIYQCAFYTSGGFTVVHANQPRWTNNVTLASAPFVVSTSDDFEWCVLGWIPSGNLNPTFSGCAANTFTANTNVLLDQLIPYAGYLNFRSNVYSSNVNVSGAQGLATINSAVAETVKVRTDLFPFPPWGSPVTLSLTHPGSGYTQGPNVTACWGAGANLWVDLRGQFGSHTVNTIANVEIVPLNGNVARISQYASLTFPIADSYGPPGPNISVTYNGLTGSVPNVMAISSITSVWKNAANNNPLFALDLCGQTITISNSTHPGNNGTFVIIGYIPGHRAWNSVINDQVTPGVIYVRNDQGANDTSNAVHWKVQDGSGGGSGYYQANNAQVPIWIADMVGPDGNTATVYTTLGYASIAPGPSGGQVNKVTLHEGYTNVNIGYNSDVRSEADAGNAVWAFVPGPIGSQLATLSIPEFGFGTGGTEAFVLGCSNTSSANVYATVSFNQNGNVNTQSSSGVVTEDAGSCNLQGTAQSLVQNIQGSYYMLSCDTWSDFATHNDVASPYRNVPMRLIGSIQPRLGLSNVYGTCNTLTQAVTDILYSGTSFAPIVLSSGAGGIVEICAVPLVSQVSDLLTPQPEIPRAQWCELGGMTAWGAGLPYQTDTTSVTEFAFPYYPENITANVDPGGSGYQTGILNGSTYGYIASYSRTDRYGNIHRSGRSVPVTVTTLPTYDGSLYRATLEIPTMGFSYSQRGIANIYPPTGSPPTQQPIQIQLHRTLANGDVYYSCADYRPQGGSGPSYPTASGVAQNSLWAPYVTVRDGAWSDSSISNNGKLYGDGSDGVSSGSILDNLMPPAFQGLITHKSRLWGIDGPRVWYTKAITTGEGLGFNEQMAFSVDDGPGPVVALASMDERLVIFKRDRIFYMTGDGPDDRGMNNDLQPPQRILSDVGAVSWRGVVSFPGGIFFQSDNGIYLLTRKLEVQPAGKFVEDVLTSFPSVISTALDAASGSVYFLLALVEGVLVQSSIIVQYSYTLDVWSTYVPPSVAGSLNVQSICTSYQYTPLSLTGDLWVPSLTAATAGYSASSSLPLQRYTPYANVANSYMWANNYVPGVWESNWIKGSAIEGFLHFWKVLVSLHSLDPHQLTVSIGYNYNTTYTDTFTVGASAMANVTTPTVQWEFQPSSPKAESMRIKITDSADAVIPPLTGAGPQIFGVTVVVGTHEGTFRIPVTQRGSK